MNSADFLVNIEEYYYKQTVYDQIESLFRIESQTQIVYTKTGGNKKLIIIQISTITKNRLLLYYIPFNILLPLSYPKLAPTVRICVPKQSTIDHRYMRGRIFHHPIIQQWKDVNTLIDLYNCVSDAFNNDPPVANIKQFIISPKISHSKVSGKIEVQNVSDEKEQISDQINTNGERGKTNSRRRSSVHIDSAIDQLQDNIKELEIITREFEYQLNEIDKLNISIEEVKDISIRDIQLLPTDESTQNNLHSHVEELLCNECISYIDKWFSDASISLNSRTEILKYLKYKNSN